VIKSVQVASTLSARVGLPNLVGEHKQRRVWSQAGRAYIEVRGLAAGAGGPLLRRALEGALRGLHGVTTAEINAVTGEVLIAFEEEEVTPDQLVDAIEDIEEARSVQDEGFPGHGHPAEPASLTAETLALVADGLGIAVATTGRLVRFPKIHRGARLLFSVVDNQPRLRRQVESRLGPHGTDFVLALGNAVAHGLSHEPAMMAVDALHRMLLVAEIRERRAVWSRREKEICARALRPTVPAAARSGGDLRRPQRGGRAGRSRWNARAHPQSEHRDRPAARGGAKGGPARP
jgi:cation-transporting ATPase I